MANRHDATEKPTAKRRREARKRGQVPRSVDVSGAAVFLVVVIALHIGFATTFNAVERGFVIAIQHLPDAAHHESNFVDVWSAFIRATLPFIALVAFGFVAAAVAGIGANVLQFGLLFSPELLTPKFSKLNPISGLQRIFFSPQTIVQLLKQLLKLGAVVVIVYMSIRDHIGMFYTLAHADPHQIAFAIEGLLFQIGLRFGIFLLVLGLIDYVWERRRLENSLKMTKTEVKDEHRQSEGNPEARAALRQRQRAMARRRMMAAVPKATVVVTNPTHFAVALQWDDVLMDAPVVTAKGADLLAKRIRELAREHNVPVLENPPLARTLYDKVELDSPVPPNLYAAVAQVIAFVYKLKNRTIA